MKQTLLNKLVNIYNHYIGFEQFFYLIQQVGDLVTVSCSSS